MSSTNDSEDKVTKRTVYNMFNDPTKSTISTLLKVCDTLNINLSHVFRAIDTSVTSVEAGDSRLIYNINNNAYKAYIGEFHIFFLTTQSTDEMLNKPQLVHGTIEFGDMLSLGECNAKLIINSGDTTKDGKPFTKEYTGKLVFSTTGVMFCNLISNTLGDMWFLVFNHGYVNNGERLCAIGCAATCSSGIHRHPAIHNFCLCNKENYPVITDEMKEHIQGLLKIKNDKILISEKNLSQFLAQTNLDENFKNNVNTAIETSEKYYVILRENLKPNVNAGVLAKTMAELCDKSDLPHVFHSLDYDDTQLQLVLGAPTDNHNTQ